MWQHISHPDILIFLDVSYEQATLRRKLNWTVAEYEEQQRRLAHARQHADIYVNTTSLTPHQVLSQVLDMLRNHL